MEYGWIWIAVVVLAVVVEIFTNHLVSIWFVPAAIVSLILDFCHVQIVWQIVAFIAVSAVGVVMAKTFLSKYLKPSQDSKTNIDAIVGSKCIVTEKIDNYAGCGMARVNGQLWSARSVSDDDVFESGEILRIVAIEGVKLICKKDN